VGLYWRRRLHRYIDDDDFLFVVDCVKDMVVTDGMNVSFVGSRVEHPAVQSGDPACLADHITPMGRPHRVLPEARSATRSKLEGSK
jgi:hypothetical protein